MIDSLRSHHTRRLREGSDWRVARVDFVLAAMAGENPAGILWESGPIFGGRVGMFSARRRQRVGVVAS
jgi:hypothetical protein